ncbi:pseudouridine synthase [Pseudogracilibacillus sp. SO30301A]|uniref:pseudouridine synthase n=1 Tax=Pseudogracilibacillus sp. SO30301A TaxID=3098291 RepID=UPI00300DFFC4
MRLDKLLAHTGFGTRKEVKELIKKRLVTVDNNVITKSNLHVNPDEQLIEVNKQKVHYQKYMYIMLHKPPKYLSATVDLYDQTVLDLIPLEYQHYDLSPVGRLDKDTEGLLLLTNDGQLNHAFTSPNREIYKTYFAKIKGKVFDNHIEQFREGIILDDGYKTKEAYLEIVKSDSISEIKLAICEGKFHQVKRMFRAINMEVLYLKRLSIGDLQLDKDLPIGKCRKLTEDELAYVLSMKK